ncbi:tetraacyldisaccharide 4'-kinase [Hymenobacter sp. BRD67]|uniref:tetraacyldisaccharide 4'-kinase n=1 Tax=Hymenobacter sp. BRD67 TaxID=2675877 RepID=UPI0015636815|nr:tetraacyldisaccharide 4'-kinase [Hymenobacter sp. BRD67]QKG52343.1 tetraacyldisaccharide 4'-kinase [Hymenobacter sp. BRD67]
MLTSWLAWLLLPLSWLYAAVLAGRNWLYDHGYKHSAAGWVPLLSVGNLRVGGTGKTPHVAWLVQELLRQGQQPAILSRGYGRQTKGPRLATLADSAATIGDEPCQYFQEFNHQRVPVAVAENRQLGLDLLRQHHPELTCVVLDDAYQHRRVRPTLNILLTELARPFYTDFVLPAGRLREARAGAARADVVILTKCPPGLSAHDQAAAEAQVRRYARPGQLSCFRAMLTPRQCRWLPNW